MAYYLSPDELADSIEESIAQSQPTVRLCENILLMADHILRAPSYQRYAPDIKDDLKSCCLEKCLRSVKNYKPERRKSVFAYYTRTCLTAIWDWLTTKHYKHINLRNKLILEAAHRCIDPRQKEYLESMVLSGNTTHTLDKTACTRKRRSKDV